MNIDGADVLLTGATGGIGHAIARSLAARGARLVVTGRRADILEPLAAEIGGRAIASDLADPASLDDLIGQVETVDILVANAALPASGDLLGFSVDQIDRALTVNLRAPIVLSRHYAQQMISRGSGHQVFISSLSGKSAVAGTSIYSATKFGLRGFALGVREDLRPHGVGASCIFPGFISEAGMFAETQVQLPRGVGSKTPEDVARAVVSAIEKNRAEIDVAPVAMKLGSAFALVAPEVAGALGRRLGSNTLSADIAAAQQSKR